MLRILLGVFLLISFHSVQAAPFHVILDPGHGGNDFGTTQDSFVESKIVLSIAEKLKADLEKHTIQVTLTREADSHLTLQQRVQMANGLNADLFLSLHANWSRSKQVSGFEFYFSAQNSYPERIKRNGSEQPLAIIEAIKADLALLGRQKQSLEFSQTTQSQIEDKKSVIRRAPFYVIENTLMPAVLIEVGFISNRREAKQLASPEYQSEIAQILTKSILSYKDKE